MSGDPDGRRRIGAQALREKEQAFADGYPEIGDDLGRQLAAIEPSVDDDVAYYPCAVALADGRTVERVYVVEALQYIRHWGIFLNEGPADREIAIEDVRRIGESPHRLPAALATKLYRAGESGMGYMIFTIVFEDGSCLPCLTGDAVDFLDLPAAFASKAMIDVLPHTGREAMLAHRPLAKNARSFWCLHRRRAA